jgi:hypothetical protein
MAGQILFDATRLVTRRRGAPPTGIDRVVLAYARWLTAQTTWPVIPVATWEGRLVPMNRNGLHGLLDARQTPGSEPTWSALIAALNSDQDEAGVRSHPTASAARRTWKDMGEIMRPFRGGRLKTQPGDIYLNVSHSGLERAELFSGLGQRGLRSAVMIHDLIPLTHPEFCGPGAPERHCGRIQGVLRHADLVLTNSEATANDLRAYARTQDLRTPPIHVAYLGLEAAFASPESTVLAARPYFVCVGTIEARKNLAFILTLWRRLAEHMGTQTPRLILVGRRGWENEAVIDHLDRSPAVRTLVHEVSDLDDRQLATLLAGARALLAPSMAEGFDLPVMEASAVGTPVIASDIPVHRELAGKAQLIDPLDGMGWLSAIEAACKTRPTPGPRRTAGWESHFAGVAGALAQINPTDHG